MCVCLVFIDLLLAALGLCCCARAFSSCRESGLFSSCGAQASCCSGFSYCRACALGLQKLQHMGSVVVTHRLNCPVAMWDPPGPGIKPASPVLQGRFLTTGPPGKSQP